MNNTALLLRAATFAAEKHSKQRRKDAEASPYINHPLQLASLLANEGRVHDPVVICAALLHDTLEDTESTADELKTIFGDKVMRVVQEVSDDKSLPKATRKALQIEHAAQLSHAAKLVKLADKICNLRDLLRSPPADWSLARKQEYFDWAASVVSGLRGHNAALEAIFDHVHAQRDTL